MVTPAVNTIIKMIEQLPESEQERVAEHLREYLAALEMEGVRHDHAVSPAG